MRDKYAETLRELLQAKVEQRAASNRGCAGGQGSPKEVINIMAALKENTQAKGRPKCGMRCRDEWASSLRRKSHGRALHDPRPSPRRTAQARSTPGSGCAGGTSPLGCTCLPATEFSALLRVFLFVPLAAEAWMRS